MSARLSALVAHHAEQLATDLDADRYGDPHVAFAVLVYPDREPELVAVTEVGAIPLRKIRKSEQDNDDEPAGRFFTYDDFTTAMNAMSDADFAMRYMGGLLAQQPLGECIAEHVQEKWARRIQYAIERELRGADELAKRPAKCEACGRRFTERGLPMHLARARHCAEQIERDQL